MARVHARAGRIERKLADRYAHAVCTQIAQPENALTVGDHDDAYIRLRPIAQHVGDFALVVERNEHAVRPAKDVAIMLTGLSDHGRVDDRHHLLDVIHQHPVEQRFIAVL